MWKFASASFVTSMPGIVASPAVHTPVLCMTTVFTRGIVRDAQRLQAAAAPSRERDLRGSMRPKYGLPARSFSASAQSIASVRSDASVRGAGGWPGCAGGALAAHRAAEDAAARDHEIAVRRELEQMKAAARAVVRAAAVAPGDDAELLVAERGEIGRPIHDVLRQRRRLLPSSPGSGRCRAGRAACCSRRPDVPRLPDRPTPRPLVAIGPRSGAVLRLEVGERWRAALAEAASDR